MSNIKGSAVRSVIDFVKIKGDSSTWLTVVSQLSDEDRDIFSGVILSPNWYPMQSYHNLLLAISNNLSASSPEIGIDIGKKIIEDGLTGIYKTFLKILTPEYVMSKVPILWRRYFDGEQLELVEVTEKKITMEVIGEIKPPKVYCYTVIGGMIKGIELAGGKNVVGREIKCRASGCESCRFSVVWE